MPAAVAIPLIVGAGTTVAGAEVQAHGAKEAAKTQAAAADKALQLNKQIYDDQMRMVSPYVQFGTQSLANLGRLSSTPFSEQTNGFVNAARGGPVPQFQQGMVNPAQGLSLGQLGQGPRRPMMGGRGMPMGGPMGAPMGGPMVTVRDDTGATRQVPAAHATAYRQRGFQVMG